AGLIAKVKLDLLSCVEMRAMRPGDTKHDMYKDTGAVESMLLVMFELEYSDSIEQLEVEMQVEMRMWFDAIQFLL
ncbi:uncharacterized protein PHACADRAFT_109087, partial [Phanerochaete carnosa HHB-10118-sp]